MLALISGILIGFILAIPPGPLGITAIRLGLSRGLRAGVSFATGAGVVDIGFCYIALVATSAIISAVGNLVSVHPMALLIFQLGCILGLIIYGITQFRKRSPAEISSEIGSGEDPEEELKKKNIGRKRGFTGPFFLGAGIALANAANPSFLPSLTYLGVFVQKYHIIVPRWYNFILFALGFGAGSFAWFYVLVRLILHYRERMSGRLIELMHRFAGVTLIGFALYLAWRVVVFTNWSNFS